MPMMNIRVKPREITKPVKNKTIQQQNGSHHQQQQTYNVFSQLLYLHMAGDWAEEQQRTANVASSITRLRRSFCPITID